VGLLFQLFFLNCTLAFFRAQLHLGDQAAEVLITRTGRNEKGKTEVFVIPSRARHIDAMNSVPGIEILRLRKCFTS
jgi:hypothetical protein